MREIRPSGSEGGGAYALSLPLSADRSRGSFAGFASFAVNSVSADLTRAMR
jgi:hypothetical protein